jgi:hypothetical protein
MKRGGKENEFVKLKMERRGNEMSINGCLKNVLSVQQYTGAIILKWQSFFAFT